MSASVVAVCIVAVCIAVAALALAFLALGRGDDRWNKVSVKLSDHECRLNTHSDCMARRIELDELRRIVDANIDKFLGTMDAHIRKDDAGAKMIGLALAERIDALSARMDAVELKTGLREKAKTAGGVD